MKIDDSKIQSHIQKARMLGLNVETVEQGLSSIYYIIHKSSLEHIILIPSSTVYTGHILLSRQLNGNVRVIGGSGITDAEEMFRVESARSINILDLTEFDASNIENMSSMFWGRYIDEIRFGDFNTSKVKDMSYMFYSCAAKSLDLSSFDTSNVEDMNHMFEDCAAQYLNLKSFNTRKVRDMSNMFDGMAIEGLDLTSFDASNTVHMDDMFNVFEGTIKAHDDKILDRYRNDTAYS